MAMDEPVIVDAVRTPVGRRNGALSGVHAAHLLGVVLRAVVDRAGVDACHVDQVIGGCVTQIGEQAYNVTRNAWLGAGLPQTTAAATIDMQCSSSQQANHIVAAMIKARVIEVGIASGLEMMSRSPLGANGRYTSEVLFPWGAPQTFPDQFTGADRLAAARGVTRPETEALAICSNRRAAAAWREGRFDREVVPVSAPLTGLVTRDECFQVRAPEELAALRPINRDGIHTPATVAPMCDCAAAVLWMSRRRARALGVRPRARIVAQTAVGTDPYYSFEGPVPASRRVLEASGMNLCDIDLFEVNEAFAAVVLAWARTFEPDMDRVNVNGGALAFGHPLGASGGRLFATALHELERANLETALVAMCAGGGVGTAAILQRLDG
jgi:acetyl-CoA C-acetyltransferase